MSHQEPIVHPAPADVVHKVAAFVTRGNGAARELLVFRHPAEHVQRPGRIEAAIIPILVGDTAFAIRIGRRLLEEGVFVTGSGWRTRHQSIDCSHREWTCD